MNFYPHHIGDFNNATRHLTRVERSVYRDAIELYYDQEMLLSVDIKRLQKKLLCRSDEEKQALNDILDEFFDLQDDGYFHERCDSEITKYRSNISAKAKAGIASAKARKEKAAQRKQNLTGVKSSSTGVHNQEPLTNNQEPSNKKNIKKKTPSAKSKKFIKPNVQEIAEFILEKKLNVDPQDFFDSNEMKGWVVGKNKTPMKCWKSAIGIWHRNGYSNKSKTQINDNDTKWLEDIQPDLQRIYEANQ